MLVAGFDPDEYVKGGWKTAVEAQNSHYARLGLNAQDHVTTNDVRTAHAARMAWWNQLSRQAESGRNNPRIAELSPYIKSAMKNLQEAVDVLADVDRKTAYDRQLELAGAKAAEEKFREFVDFTLRDKVLTSTERNDLLDQARDLGIRRDRAEELIQHALKETGAIEGQPSSVPVIARPEVSVLATGTDSPQLVVGQTSFSLGVLSRGDRRHGTFSVDNRGGGVLAGSIHSSHPEWLIVSQPELDPRRHHQEIGFTVDTSKLDLGLNYVGAIALNSNGGRESVRVECSIELQSALLSRWRKQVFWAGIPTGAIFGLILYHLLPSQLAYNVTQVAGLVGAIAFVVVCAVAGKWGGGIGGLFLASIVQKVFMHTTVVGYSAVAWAEIASVFLFFWAKPLLTARLAGNARMRFWAVMSGFLVAALIISCGVAFEQNIPQALGLRLTAASAKGSPSEFAIRGMISQWAAAHTANDVALEIAFYAPIVHPYFDHRSVSREFIQQSMERLRNKGVTLSRYEVDRVTVTMHGDRDATVNLEKLWSTRPSGLPLNHTRSQVHIRDFDGRWLITGERDF